MLVTRVPALYLKMPKNTRQKLAESFSEGTFQLSLLQYIHSIEPCVACELTVVNYDRQANFECDLFLFLCSSTHSITHSSRLQYASYGGRRHL